MTSSQRGPYVLGLDLGTSSLKALVADAAGVVRATVSHPYALQRPRPGWAEQSPADWESALLPVMRQLRERGVALDAIAAIGLSGQMHGLVLLDAAGDALGPCHIWADTRCASEARGMEERIGRERLRRISGSPAYTSATAGKLLWVREHEPERLRAAAHLLLPKDYLRWRLTGVLATDVSDASGTQLCDISTRDWSGELLDALDISADLLPPVYESTAVTGSLVPEMARALGLRAGIPVVAGGGDAECAAVGQGVIGETADRGLGLATLGTAGQFFAVTASPGLDPAGELQTLCHAVPGRWHVMRCILAGASTVDWLASALLPDAPPDVAMRALLAEAANEPPGARGVLFLPHLNGIRTPEMDADAAGAFVGLRASHTRATLARAALEGVALAIREGLDAVRALGMPVERVRLAGGANRFAPWPQLQADVYGLPVELGPSEDASALGAALLAAAGVGATTLADAAATLVANVSDTYAPDTAASAHYDRLAPIFAQLAPHLRATFSGLAEANAE